MHQLPSSCWCAFPGHSPTRLSPGAPSSEGAFYCIDIRRLSLPQMREVAAAGGRWEGYSINSEHHFAFAGQCAPPDHSPTRLSPGAPSSEGAFYCIDIRRISLPQMREVAATGGRWEGYSINSEHHFAFAGQYAPPDHSPTRLLLGAPSSEGALLECLLFDKAFNLS